MKHLLLNFILALPCAACPQETGKTEIDVKTTPIHLKTTFSNPQIEVLKVEDSENRHYEKWRQKTLVVFGLIPVMDVPQSFETESLKQVVFNLNLQSKPRRGDYKKRLDDLKKELELIDSDSPKLKKWDSSNWTVRGSSTFPINEMVASNCRGQVYYTWLYREYEIEGIKQNKKMVFTAKIKIASEGAIVDTLPKGQTFDLKTGEKVAGEIAIPKAESEITSKVS